MFSSKPKFDANKAKVQLKMLINRLNLLTSKKSNLAKAEKRKVAMLLRDDKEHNARILVEQIIREDYTLEAYDVIKQYTEMLIARFNVVVTEQELKPEVADAVCALVYSGWLMGSEIDELKALFMLFTAKYGKVYTQEVLDNKDKYINARLLKILSSTQVPDASVIDAYLTEIAKTYGVEYIPRPPSAVQPVSATLGIALPTPGMPMPAPLAEPVEISDAHGAGVSLPPSGGEASGSAAVPVAPIMAPTAPVAAGVPTPYTIVLTKSTVLGFGLILDSDNVVQSVKPGSEAASMLLPGAGQVLSGDRVLAIDGKPVSPETPAKSIAADIDSGVAATFTMLRLPGLPVAGAVPAPTVATPVAPAEPPTAPVPMPPLAGIYPPAAPVVTGTVPPALPACTEARPAASCTSTQPAAPPAAAPAALPEDADDLLARRLAALKRGP